MVTYRHPGRFEGEDRCRFQRKQARWCHPPSRKTWEKVCPQAWPGLHAACSCVLRYLHIHEHNIKHFQQNKQDAISLATIIMMMTIKIMMIMTMIRRRANAQTIHIHHTYRTISQSSSLYNQPSRTSSAFPSYISGVHHFWWDFCVYDRFFNPTIKVVTFHLRGWCVLGVFLLPAFTRLGHKRQDLLSPCDEMHVCTD